MFFEFTLPIPYASHLYVSRALSMAVLSCYSPAFLPFEVAQQYTYAEHVLSL